MRSAPPAWLPALAVSFLAPAAVLVAADAPPATAAPFVVSIQIDAAKPVGEMKPFWRFFGADEPNYATMKDGHKLLAELGELRPKDSAQPTYFRAHNLLTSGDGTPAPKWGSTNAYTEDAQGRPIYSWTILDNIFDTYLARGVRPYAEIGFMPEALSTKPAPYQHEFRPGLNAELYTGWAYPPKDYEKWGELVYQWAKHCVERYGKAEVEKWYWEVWNEANIGYWKGTPEEFYKLHDYAIAAVRRALPTARVGGMDSAGTGGTFMTGFIEHALRGTNYATGQKGTPLDFISFHAKGAPSFVDGHVRMGIANQLRDINNVFTIVASHPELKNTPIVFGESDPDTCAACTARVSPQNNYRNGSLFASYSAATFGRELAMADRAGVNLEGVTSWAFEFEDQAYFDGFRVLATNGIDLPVLNTFKMFSKMSGQRVAVTSTGEVPLDAILSGGGGGARGGARGARGAAGAAGGVRDKPDVTALASLDAHKLAVLVWHYHDDDVPGPAADVSLALAGLPAAANGNVRLAHWRIDDEHSNAFTAWKKMGSPAGPNASQYRQLVAAGQLGTMAETPAAVVVTGGAATLEFVLPRQGVSLLVLEW
ncbi:MAG: beta-xylosidase [Verrucomicrobiota bacterium]